MTEHELAGKATGQSSPPAPLVKSPAAGDVLACVLLGLWALMMLVRIRYGYECYDEGMYLSAADRLVHGDLPFRDDQENPLRCFDILLAAVAMPFGGLSLIGMRSLGVVLQIGQMLVLWATVRRFAGSWTAALACCVVPCVPLFGVWTPGYNEMSGTCTVLVGCLLALSASGGRRMALACGTGAGLALGLGTLAYLPSILVAVVPAALVLATMTGARFGGKIPDRQAGSARLWMTAGALTVAVAAAVVAVAAVALMAGGLSGYWWTAVRATIAQQRDAAPFAERLGATLAAWSVPGLRLAAVVAGLVLLRRAAQAHALAGRTALVAGLVVAVSVIAGAGAVMQFLRAPGAVDIMGTNLCVEQVWYAEMILGLGLVAVFTAPAALAALWRRDIRGAAAGLGIASAVFFVYAGITGLASSLGAMTVMNIRMALLAVGVAGFAIFLRNSPPAPRRAVIAAGVCAQAAGAAAVVMAMWSLVPPWDYPAEFTRGPLAGVHSGPNQVQPLEAVQGWVDAHEPPAARMIAYHAMPALYFALGRRPAVGWTWTTAWWSWTDSAHSYEFLGELVDDMRRRGVRADFCVRRLAMDGAQWPYAYCLADPLHVAVDAGFRPVWQAWPYEVLLPRDAAHPAHEPAVIADLCSAQPFAATVRVIIAPTVGMALDDAGGVVMTVTGNGRMQMPVQVLDHGAGEVGLRLRVQCDDPLVFAVLARDGDFSLINGRQDGNVPGWDATYPALPAGGAESDRGFALALPAMPPGQVRRVRFTRLRLERSAPAP
jgi:hypothetical protein